ncbi:UDP-N-acetylmuramoyl-L-alanine--D-glutamate ligase [Candidatus Rickettsiella isopodorum]|jgi:UDP-N-acetylmuramoylalanine--D-glutamate ligase|uniref:UDP-N-acetylmuramoyl-L-alanine--D-glutamate ligase n=1 Tax=Candidatus Rickettsiella isopodorum TaxID=1225476 RepID=UPI0008FD4B5E|nr:UDP-N-acetylmuramoyl-L-alanine--D-glutamate ligase [Candidatus Rickettsiella isopodorum]
MPHANSSYTRLILGLGETGLSCARYFKRLNLPFTLLDSRLSPPKLSVFKKEFPQVAYHLGPFDPIYFQDCKELIVSPGIDLNERNIHRVISLHKLKPIGDIELFAQQARAPIIAITGSNAKGTVTSLVGDMIHQSKLKVAVGGNIGKPALDLLDEPIPDFYVLEISSFQLETTYSLQPKLASILNISPDHLDRHKTLATYIQVKQRIYHGSEIAVWNREDLNTFPDYTTKKITSFGLESLQPGSQEFGLQVVNQKPYLAKGNQILLSVDKIPIKGRHNWANTLAALTIGHAIGLPPAAMLTALCQFKGLPHRCQWIKEHKGVTWYNDSKATNVGATLAALNGLGPAISGKIILIAGGLAKGADFSLLNDSVKRYVKKMILMGRDAALLKNALEKSTSIELSSDLAQAVKLAHQTATQGDIVLLSPACASMDMFKNYEARGDTFISLVRGIH